MMERLTVKIKNRVGVIWATPPETTIDAALTRLAAYEDTGLEPEEINRIIDAYGRGLTLQTDVGERLEIIKDIQTERLKQLAQAEKDGRLVVLPCKDGQTIWAESCIKGRATSFEAPDITWIIENTARFGTEIFLTREEAEAALKNKEADNETD